MNTEASNAHLPGRTVSGFEITKVPSHYIYVSEPLNLRTGGYQEGDSGRDRVQFRLSSQQRHNRGSHRCETRVTGDSRDCKSRLLLFLMEASSGHGCAFDHAHRRHLVFALLRQPCSGTSSSWHCDRFVHRNVCSMQQHDPSYCMRSLQRLLC